MDFKSSVEASYSFLDANKAEMTLFGTRYVGDIETTTVIGDGESQFVRKQFAGDFKMVCLAMTDGVERKFPNNAQNRMHRIIRDSCTGNVEMDVDCSIADMWLERTPYCLCDVWDFQCLASQIPQYVAKLFTA